MTQKLELTLAILTELKKHISRAGCATRPHVLIRRRRRSGEVRTLDMRMTCCTHWPMTPQHWCLDCLLSVLCEVKK